MLSRTPCPTTHARALAACAAFLAPALALAGESVTIPLTGIQIRNATNQARSSDPDTVDPANNYTVSFSDDTRVRGVGEGGFAIYVLPTLFPNPVTIDQVLQTLTNDPTADFPNTTEVANPAGTHPFIAFEQILQGSGMQQGVILTFSASIRAEILANDVVSFSVTDVVLTSNNAFIRPGYMQFTSGTITVTRNPVVCDSIDFNNDGGSFDPTDIDAFLSVYSEGPCIPASASCNDIDFNNDGGFFDPCDIDSFLLVYSEGPCSACGV